MGTNIDLKKYLDERLLISNKILDVFKNWDGDMESMEDVVEESGVLINRLKNISLKISDSSIDKSYDGDYENNLKEIIRENKNFIDRVEIEKSKLLKNIKQTDKVKEIRNSYVSPEVRPMFIDKDL